MRAVLVVLAAAAIGCGAPAASPGGCVGDGDCPLHQFCEASACRSGCLAAADCGGARCGDHGRCHSGDDEHGGDGGEDLSSPMPAMDLSLAPPPDLAAWDAFICVGGCPDAALEPNDSPAAATVESDGASLPSLAVCPKGDVDYFKVTASRKGTLTATVTNGPCGAPVSVAVLAADGTTVLGASVATATGASAGATVAKGDVCYVQVKSHAPGGQNFYALKLDVN